MQLHVHVRGIYLCMCMCTCERHAHVCICVHVPVCLCVCVTGVAHAFYDVVRSSYKARVSIPKCTPIRTCTNSIVCAIAVISVESSACEVMYITMRPIKDSPPCWLFVLSCCLLADRCINLYLCHIPPPQHHHITHTYVTMQMYIHTGTDTHMFTPKQKPTCMYVHAHKYICSSHHYLFHAHTPHIAMHTSYM